MERGDAGDDPGRRRRARRRRAPGCSSVQCSVWPLVLPLAAVPWPVTPCGAVRAGPGWPVAADAALGRPWSGWSGSSSGRPPGRSADRGDAPGAGPGRTESWRLTLQSTWPAGPTPELLLFVPLLVLLAVCSAWRRWTRWARGGALLPSLVVLGLGQAYSAVPGDGGAGRGWATRWLPPRCSAPPAAAGRRGRAGRRPARRSAATRARVAVRTAATAVVRRGGRWSPRSRWAPAAGLGGPVRAGPDPAGALQPGRQSAGRDRRAAQPPGRRGVPGTDRGPVDRWRLVVLDRFDGAAWSPDEKYLRLGAELPPVAVTTAPLRRQAAIPLDGRLPWVPSQAAPPGDRGRPAGGRRDRHARAPARWRERRTG